MVRLTVLALVSLTAFVTTAANADLWIWRDETGKAHFAPYQVDPRYELFYKGKTNLDVTPPVKLDPADLEGTAAVIRDRVTGHPNVTRFTPLIERQAKARGLDPALVKALVAVESAFDPAAISSKGAVGLMQVIPATAERYGLASDPQRSIVDKLMDPATNLRIGTRYLEDLVKRFDANLPLALAAYNAGEHAVERYGRRIPPYPETQAYVTLVQQFRDLYAPAPPPPAPPTRVVIPRRSTAK